MSGRFILPSYDGASLANVLPSVVAALGGATGPIALPEADKYVILLVDGLGLHALSDHRDDAEHLGAMLPHARRLTCSVPSTTATSLTSLGCGTPPGEHGVVGYTFVDPSTDKLLNALTWEGGPEDVAAFTRRRTMFQRLADGGRGSAAVSLARFADSALTRMAFGGTVHHGVIEESDPEAFCELVNTALHDADVVYCYERLLDHTGHGHGVGSWQWLDQLANVDDLVAALSDSLPDGACLLVTGDHGMVNVPVDHRVVAEDHRELAGFRHIAGEGRFRQLHTDAPSHLAEAWAGFLGDRAHVVLREQAIDEGWFGPVVDDQVKGRIGDVLVAMRDDWAVMSRTFPGEFNLVGMHGSMTEAEMLVPLFVIGPR